MVNNKVVSSGVKSTISFVELKAVFDAESKAVAYKELIACYRDLVEEQSRSYAAVDSAVKVLDSAEDNANAVGKRLREFEVDPQSFLDNLRAEKKKEHVSSVFGCSTATLTISGAVFR